MGLKEVLIGVGALAVWCILTRWVFPRFGIKT